MVPPTVGVIKLLGARLHHYRGRGNFCDRPIGSPHNLTLRACVFHPIQFPVTVKAKSLKPIERLTAGLSPSSQLGSSSSSRNVLSI